MHGQCDATHTVDYLHSHRTMLPYDHYQIILLGDKDVCEQPAQGHYLEVTHTTMESHHRHQERVVLTLVLDQQDVDWCEWSSRSSARVKDVPTDATRDARQRRRYQTERGTCLHHGTHGASWTQRQAVTSGQVSR